MSLRWLPRRKSVTRTEEPAGPSLPLALATLVTSLAVVLVGGIILDVGFLVPLLVAAGVAAVFALAMGYRWESIQDGILQLLAKGLIAILILLLVGAVIGVWILGGTVPIMVSWGLELLSPQTFLLGAFLLCTLFALATGTSFGAIGSAGLALLGVGQAMGYPVGVIVGAIVGGAFLGDKASPVSDTANTASAITGVNLFRHLSSLLYITVPAAVVTAVIYGIWGANHTGGATPEQVADIQTVLDRSFTLSPLSMLPPLLLIVAAVLRVSPLPALALSLVAGSLVAITVHGASLTQVLTVATSGYQADTGNKLIDGLLTGGGLESMYQTIALIICALTLGGVLERTGTLRVILAALIRVVRGTGALITSVLVSCWLMLAGTGNVFVAHLPRRPPVQLELRPQAKHLLGGPDDRRAHPAPAQRPVGEGTQRGPVALQGDQVGAGKAQRVEAAAAEPARLAAPQFATETPRIHAKVLDPRGDHAGRDRVGHQHRAHGQPITLVEQPRSSKPQHKVKRARSTRAGIAGPAGLSIRRVLVRRSRGDTRTEPAMRVVILVKPGRRWARYRKELERAGVLTPGGVWLAELEDPVPAEQEEYLRAMSFAAPAGPSGNVPTGGLRPPVTSVPATPDNAGR